MRLRRRPLLAPGPHHVCALAVIGAMVVIAESAAQQPTDATQRVQVLAERRPRRQPGDGRAYLAGHGRDRRRRARARRPTDPSCVQEGFARVDATHETLAALRCRGRTARARGRLQRDASAWPSAGVPGHGLQGGRSRAVQPPPAAAASPRARRARRRRARAPPITSSTWPARPRTGPAWPTSPRWSSASRSCCPRAPLHRLRRSAVLAEARRASSAAASSGCAPWSRTRATSSPWSGPDLIVRWQSRLGAAPPRLAAERALGQRAQRVRAPRGRTRRSSSTWPPAASIRGPATLHRPLPPRRGDAGATWRRSPKTASPTPPSRASS